jgi:tripartite-type tricarboxylate transporter receptor subunit TctC
MSSITRRNLLATGIAVVSGIAPSFGAGKYPLLEGKTVTILVGSEVGGNFDLFARAIGRHFERMIPGLRAEIKNVPQASGALAARTIQEGSSDGLTLITSSSGLLSAQVQGDESVAYDLGTWNWMGRLATETRVIVRGRGADFATYEELRAKHESSSMSVRSKTSYAYHEALWLNAMLGLRIKPIPGFKAMEKETALVQGEVMLTVVGYPTDADVIAQPDVDVVLRLTEGPLPDHYANRPLLADLIAGNPSIEKIGTFMKVSTAMQNWMAAPPGTPPAVLAEWRQAFEAAAETPQYLDEASKLGFQTALLRGADLQQQIETLLSDLPALRAQLAAAANCGTDLAEGKPSSCALL